MKQYKNFILILIILTSLCFFSIVEAIKLDFLENSPSLQPPPNIPSGVISDTNQNQPLQKLPAPNSLQGDNLSDSENNNSKTKTDFQYNFLEKIIVLIVVVIICVLLFYIIKKKNLLEKF